MTENEIGILSTMIDKLESRMDSGLKELKKDIRGVAQDMTNTRESVIRLETSVSNMMTRAECNMKHPVEAPNVKRAVGKGALYTGGAGAVVYALYEMIAVFKTFVV